MSVTQEARRTARNMSALVFASILSKGILFLWQIALGAWLGLDDYGIYNTVVGVIAIAMPLASFSMGLIVIRQVASQPHKIGDYWGALLFWQTLFSMLAYGLAVGGSALAGYNPAIVAYVAIAGISLIVDLFGSMGNDLLLAQEQMVTSSLVDIAHVFLRVSLIILAMSAGTGLLGVYLATISASLVRTLVLVSINLRRGVRPRFPLDAGVRQSLLWSSLPLMAGSVLSLAYQHADKLLTTGILGERNTGYLGPAFLVNFGVIELLSTTVLVATYPLMARYYHEARLRASFGYLIEVMARFTFLIGVPMALFTFVFAPHFIALIYPPEFAPAATVLRILIWYTCVTMVSNVFAQALLVQDQQSFTLKARVRALILNVVLSAALLAWRGDVLGAVIATLCAELLLLVQLARHFHSLGFDKRRWLARSGRVVLAGLITGALMSLSLLIHPVLAMLVGAFSYGIMVLVLRALPPEDWLFLSTLIQALPLGKPLLAFLNRLPFLRALTHAKSP